MDHLVKPGSSFKGITTIKKSALRDDGSTALWRKIRQRVLTRDQHTCQRCGLEATHVDHIVPRKLGGDDSMDNLQALCKRCNLSKGGGFFESDRTPMTPLGSFNPRNGSISHYQEASE
jgi:5-methylcytosine-specific restriction protein A